MARTVEAIFAVVPGHGAAEVRALAVRGDDSARRMEQEEAALAEEDRPVVRGGEELQNLCLRSDGDRVSEAQDPVHVYERSDESRDLGHGEANRTEKADPEECPPPPARDDVVRRSKPVHLRTSAAELLQRLSR